MVVVGGGHNGLVAAGYLARLGVNTAVLERRHVLGGAAVTEEIVPGMDSRYRISPSFLNFYCLFLNHPLSMSRMALLWLHLNE